MEENILFPQEIFMEILSWIPAKSLISSFKFVCKDWRTLIKDPDFVKMHLNRRSINGEGGRRISNNNNNHSLICKFGNELFQIYPPFNCDHPPFHFKDLFSAAAAATKMDFDFDLSSSSSRLVGSCNGLLCLSVNDDESIILLNPSTRKYKASPKELIQCPNQFAFDKSVIYGFGCYYNSTTTIDEYKVVRIAYIYPDDDISLQFQIDIYSMSSNSWRSWRKFKDIPCEISEKQSGIFLNGAVHWMAFKLGPGYAWDRIVSFNIRDEEFGLVPLPPCADVDVKFGQVPMSPSADVAVNECRGYRGYRYLNDHTILMNVRGCLGNAYFSRSKMMDIELEIWVMKEYGIGESWTKEFVIRTSDSEPPRELSGFSLYARIMTCSLIGDQILIEGRVLFSPLVQGDQILIVGSKGRTYGRRVLYDINKKKIDGDFIMEVDGFSSEKDQVDETLVSLKSSLLSLSNNRKRKNCS